jgi:hypothetical protein
MARLSAAKARDSRRKVRAERTVWQRIGQALATGWKLLVTVVLSLAGVFSFVIVAALPWQALTQKTIAIAPIGVPRVLADNGYTADLRIREQRYTEGMANYIDSCKHSLLRDL